jgi:colanic acid/amylovoran biosynthesis glycosyltransferase
MPGPGSRGRARRNDGVVVRAPRVLHLVDQFGARSQTFIYTFVTHHNVFVPEVLCRQRDLEEEFPFESVTVLPETWSRLHPSRWWSLLANRLTGRTPWQGRVERHIRDAAPDVLHAHFGQVAVRVLPAVAQQHVPLITSFYGLDATAFADSRVGQASLPRLFATGALFIAEGPVMRQRLIALGAPADRVRVVPIAIDSARYPRWSRQPGEPYVLFLARFVEKKGLPDAIAAFAAARIARPDLKMRIIGDGPEGQRARAVALTHGVAAHIEWLGPRPHAECIEYLRGASVLIQPSVTAEDGDTEGGAPTTLIEAQAIGTPIVATRHADIPHVAPAGPGIHLSNEHDVRDLAAGLIRLVNDQTSSDSGHARRQHDIRQVMPLLERCYMDAVHIGRRSAA